MRTKILPPSPCKVQSRNTHHNSGWGVEAQQPRTWLQGVTHQCYLFGKIYIWGFVPHKLHRHSHLQEQHVASEPHRDLGARATQARRLVLLAVNITIFSFVVLRLFFFFKQERSKKKSEYKRTNIVGGQRSRSCAFCLSVWIKQNLFSSNSDSM